MAEFLGIHWFVAPDPADVAEPSPEWFRTAGLALDGALYLPLALACLADVAELDALAQAAEDGEGVIIHQEHAFVDASYLVRRYPLMGDYCATAARHLRAILVKHGETN